ncbi:hypothetical protein DYB26_004567 [Aphanomyces astaci]|uniref:Uncharacterized protein n=1 Tax=Aphanomyces astaci TaxID=112090 RepID=A0A397AGE1_APHAT|nr:hypothetical protein DYB36_006973 [Aphanomyces astaci]RHY36864.1 hypothetical protein DYB34_007949 [Aphanomyces astaci]RHY70189.1 hypothetical protein DYB38_009041 [Aphanomyces astaci]RHZ08449.1 hypothetical protein DYB26_004567 [Aphanomyces astaci]
MGPQPPIVVAPNATYWFALGSTSETSHKLPTWLYDGEVFSTANFSVGDVRVANLKGEGVSWTLPSLNKNRPETRNLEYCYAGIAVFGSVWWLSIKYATYPYHFWGLALILAIGASIFVYALSSTSNFRIKKGFWWQYVIIVLLFLFAGISFFVPRIEVFRMNHTFVTVCRPKTTRALELERKLTEVVSIGVEESGEKMGEVDTRLYSIRFDFTDGTVETLLEQCSKRVAIRRCRSLNFLLAAYTPGSPLKPNKANANSVDLSPAVVT